MKVVKNTQTTSAGKKEKMTVLPVTLLGKDGKQRVYYFTVERSKHGTVADFTIPIAIDNDIKSLHEAYDLTVIDNINQLTVFYMLADFLK